MHGFSYDTALTWIPLLPIAAAMILGFVGRDAGKGIVSGLAIGSIITSFVLSLLCAISVWGGASLTTDFGTWFSLQGQGGQPLPITLGFAMDGLSAVMAVMVTGIAALIHIYSASYMHDDPGFARFFAYLNLFTGAMLILVLATSLPLLFVGWEGVGVCSYLLIGYWWKTPAYAAAAKKAFVVNRIGDLGVLIAMFLLAFSAGSVDLAEINLRAPTLFSTFSDAIPMLTVTAAALLLFIGAAGKSAQMPLYVWLPDAMAGPTPVSALIHAATMVTAGVYLCARLSPVFLASPTAMATIGVIGATTALVAGLIALAQTDLKKILAYSTVSQLGFMFGAIGVGAFSAAMFHVFTHAFFKACLFLGAGSVMHAVHAHGDADVTKLGGLRKKLPLTFATFGVSTLAIAGIPPLAGFFSKDAILAGALGAGLHGGELVSPALRNASLFVLVVLTLGALLTAFYMVRCFALVFGGEYRGESKGYDANPHESPRAMTIPLIVLAIGATVAGLLSLSLGGEGSLWSRLLGSAVVDLALTEEAKHAAHNMAMALGLVAGLVGVGAGFAMFWGKDDKIAANLDGRLIGFLHRGMGIDAFLNAVVGGTVRFVANFASAIDRTFLAPLMLDLPALLSRISSKLLVRSQDGYVQTSGVVMALGLAGVFAWIQTPHISTTVDTTLASAKLSIEAGLGQTVRVDLDSDGTWDGQGEGTIEVEHRYERNDIQGLALAIVTPPNDVLEVVRLRRKAERIDDGLGRYFRDPSAEASLPILGRAEDHFAYIRPNGETLLSRARRQGDAAVDEVRLEDSESFILGRSPARVVWVVRATIEVTNLFGFTRRERQDIVLLPAPEGAPEAPAAAADDPHAGHDHPRAPSALPPTHGEGGEQ